MTLELIGILNTGTSNVLSEALDKLDYEDLDLTLDFAQLSYITSVGLRQLLVIRKKLSEDKVRIANMNKAVHDVFSMTGFLDYFPIVTETEEKQLPEDPSYKEYLSFRVATDPDKKIIYCDSELPIN